MSDSPFFPLSLGGLYVKSGADWDLRRRYTMIAVCPILYLGWKFYHKTRIYSAKEIDLKKNLDEIEAYERTYVPSKPR